MDALESRRMLNAVTLKHGLMTVYGSTGDNTITIADTSTPAARSVTVTIDGQAFTFRSTGILRMRVFGFDGNDTIDLGDAYMPNITDVSIDAGDGNNNATDDSLGHTWNRAERVTLIGGAGTDALDGGVHTFLAQGNGGVDRLSGGAAGATLDGGDGDDFISASSLAPDGNFSTGLINALTRTASPYDALGGINLIGGAGNDAIVGNNFHRAGVSDTLTGGDGDDDFYAFGSDTITDSGNGLDATLGGNQYTPPAGVTQTATLALVVNGQTVFPANGVGNNGANNRIAVTDANGTVTMNGPNGATFLLGDLLQAAGYPTSKLAVPNNVTLTVNGFVSSLTGNQIAGYQINNGDNIVLTIT
jgi:Ca2+-binding RTX toxin-like protein